MAKTLLIHPGKCTGCRMCEMICSFRDRDNFNPQRSKVRVRKNEALGIDLPILCLHCADAPCSRICPAGAIQKGPQNIVNVDPSLCDGCQVCVENCPYGAIRYEDDRILKCDLCGEKPLCVAWCPTQAISFEEVPLEERIANRQEIRKVLFDLENREDEG